MPYIWPFGKHQGTPIDKVPATYLAWVMENLDKPEPKAEAAKELARRRGGDGPNAGQSKPIKSAPQTDMNRKAALIILVGANVLAGVTGVKESADWLQQLIAGAVPPDGEEVPF